MLAIIRKASNDHKYIFSEINSIEDLLNISKHYGHQVVFGPKEFFDHYYWKNPENKEVDYVIIIYDDYLE